MQNLEVYKPQNQIRIVTAASLFDGHDASINIMRRIIQSTGCEVIHLGHNRSVKEIVECAIQEDVQAIAITSYQGGHTEFLKYMYDLLKEKNCDYIKIFAGGGGVILPHEIEVLQNYGITRIYSPDDGRRMGLQGMINDVVQKSDFPLGQEFHFQLDDIFNQKHKAISQLITYFENSPEKSISIAENVQSIAKLKNIPVLGVTGTGGSGKSSLVDELVRRFLLHFPNKNIGIISVDPSKRKTGGALLGDRIRMNAIHSERVYMRSLATRQSNLALSRYIHHALNVLKVADFDLIILETSGIGQSDTEIIDHSNLSLYVMTPEYGAPTQLEKIDMLDFCDLVAINKFDKRGSLDALRDVKKQFQRNHLLWHLQPAQMPVYGTIASQYNDTGVNELFFAFIDKLNQKCNTNFEIDKSKISAVTEKVTIIPPERVRYLSEISETIRNYNKWVEQQATTAQNLFALNRAAEIALSEKTDDEGNKLICCNKSLSEALTNLYEFHKEYLTRENRYLLENWEKKKQNYQSDFFSYKVREKEILIETKTETLSHLKIPKISLPKYTAWGDILKWILKENVPGEFPFAAGVFYFKRENEDPTRMFAGEGSPERTNKRFHYLSKGMNAVRLSTAFDSVTLYGQNPDLRPDIYGKIGNSGVSVASLDDAKKLYSGFDLASQNTSVSMTINGPAPAMMAFFLNAAIDQQCEKYILQNNLKEEVEEKINLIYKTKNLPRPVYIGELPEGNNGLGLLLLGVCGSDVLPQEIYEKIKYETISQVRGTVQADILKEDQAQNTCIFSTDFSLKLMGDVQQYFIENNVRNFYSVSISGYHIAEAGANAISQLAFTLANGFTYVEYYMARGMDINKFAPNLSFFFSNGIDPEYSVLGRVARIIWAKAMKMKYNANERSQKLKYHIQTSGRSLHAQEIDFNDIRTTLQALYAIYDNCNSLHTNAYDEAITTPTEESVRRAVAIQLIINNELGLAKNQNPTQGSFIIEELTDLVEEAVLIEFDRITERGGVLGAMETMYQRGKIQEESMYYEHLKHSGELQIIGVNSFLSSKGSPTTIPAEVIRATEAEKQQQILFINNLQLRTATAAEVALENLKIAAAENKNVFHELMNTTKYCSLGQITNALFETGGQYRRNM